MNIKQYMKEYYKVFKKLPSLKQLVEKGYTRSYIRYNYSNKTKLDEIVLDEIKAQLLLPPISENKIYKSKSKYVIIGVQNNQPLNQDFIKTLHVYCKENNAQLLGMPIFYRYPYDIVQNNISKGYTWDTDFDGQMITRNLMLGKYLHLMAEHKIRPTVQSPLAGLESVGGRYSAIYANPQFQQVTVPETINKVPHILHTTGTACNTIYTDTNIGGKTKRFETLGAIVVTLDPEERYHLRTIIYKDDKLYDLDKVYTKEGVKPSKESAMVWGDIHAEIIDPKVLEVTLELASKINCKTHVLHDIIDFTCQSHHNKGNILLNYLLDKHQQKSIPKALESVKDFLRNLEGKVYIVDSNHHDHLFKWLNSAQISSLSHENAYFYVSTWKKLFDNADFNLQNLKPDINVFEQCLNVKDKSIKFLDRNHPFYLYDIEVSQHGDVGLNGSRGGIKNFARSNLPMVIGHSHTPGIYRDVYQVGKSAVKEQNYMRGMSSHLHTHCIIYPNGARTLINIVKGDLKY